MRGDRAEPLTMAQHRPPPPHVQSADCSPFNLLIEVHDGGLHLFVRVDQVKDVIVHRDLTPSAVTTATLWGEPVALVAWLGTWVFLLKPRLPLDIAA